MRLTAWEEQRLLVFTAAELARRHRDAGLLLNHPEAVAIVCDAMFEAARAGASYEGCVVAGRSAVREDEVLPGVRDLLAEVRLEVLLGDGSRLLVLVDPIGPGPDPVTGVTRSAPGVTSLRPNATPPQRSPADAAPSAPPTTGDPA